MNRTENPQVWHVVVFGHTYSDSSSHQEAAHALETINRDSSALTRLARLGNVSNFVRDYGDTGQDEFRERTCTISQALLVMNGDMVKDV